MNRNDEWDGAMVIPQMFVGSLSAAIDIENLRSRNVTHVLTVANRLIVDLPKDINHFQIDIADHPNANILTVLQSAIDFIDNVMGNEEMVNENIKEMSITEQPSILIHCASGVSRSVTVCCAWLMIRRQHTFDSALVAVRAHRPQAMPNIGFTHQLMLLEQENYNISSAESKFLKTNAALDISTSIYLSRQMANNIHEQVDALENEIKQNNNQCNLSNDWIMRLSQLQNKLDLIAVSETTIRDRPSEIIRKSAMNKVERLMNDLL
jgi:protein-tyrosine phosphatase